MLGNNQVAFDACAATSSASTRERRPHPPGDERGFGPVDLDKIKIVGDVTLDEARARAKGFKVGLIRVEKYFEGTAITAYAGPPPESERTDYCWGGCPGAIEEAVEILRLFDTELDAKMPRTHVVFGAYDGPIDAKPGEKVVFIGDCSTYDGEVAGKLVQIRSTYKPRDTKDPHTIAHDDIFAKMASVMMKLRAAKGEQVVRFEGCPVSVAEQVLMLVFLSGAKNPFFEPGESLAFNKAYLQWRGTMAMKRLQGIPYQKPGPAPRGEAAPVLDAPADAE
jgi:hypothetical protein